MGRKLIIRGADFSQVAVDVTTPIVDTFYIDNKNLPVDRSGIGGNASSAPFAWGGLHQDNIQGKKINWVRLYLHPEITGQSGTEYSIGQAIKVYKATFSAGSSPKDGSPSFPTSYVLIATSYLTSVDITNKYIDIEFEEITLGLYEYLFINTIDTNPERAIAVASDNPIDENILRFSITDNKVAFLGTNYGNMPWSVGYRV